MPSDRNPPPPVIDSARVMSYAFVDDIPYRKWGALYSGDQLIEHVPRLAICLNLGKDIGPLLFHCDEDWNTLGTSGAETIALVKERAERNYPGVSTRWVDLNMSVEDALRYYDEQIEGLKCSFCGKRPFEIEGGWVEGTKAAICRECVEKYHRAFQEPE
jgi:ClpX C4-type zinc finger